MKIYKAIYCPSEHENAPCTLSLHCTKLGAYKAIRQSKIKAYEEWLDRHRRTKKRAMKYRGIHNQIAIHSDEYKFDFDQWWGISETELLD